MISVDCPHCRGTFGMHDSEAGKQFDCPRCKKRVRVSPSARVVGKRSVSISEGKVAENLLSVAGEDNIQVHDRDAPINRIKGTVHTASVVLAAVLVGAGLTLMAAGAFHFENAAAKAGSIIGGLLLLLKGVERYRNESS